MRPPLLKTALTALCLSIAALEGCLTQQSQPLANTPGSATQPAPGRGGRGGPLAGVHKATIAANWFAGGTKFWYRNDLRNQNKEFILVDAQAATRKPAFDHAKLAAALGAAAHIQVNPAKLPFDIIAFTPDAKTVRFSADNANWKCDLTTYTIVKEDVQASQATPADGDAIAYSADHPFMMPREAMGLLPDVSDHDDATASPQASDDFDNSQDSPMTDSPAPPQGAGGTGQGAGQGAGRGAGARGQGGGQGTGRGGARGQGAGQGRGAGRGNNLPPGAVPQPPHPPAEVPDPANSPNGRWTALVRNFNVVIRSAEGTETQLSQDGTAAQPYARLYWSPDSSTVVAYREDVGDNKVVYRLDSSPPAPAGVAEGGAGRAILAQSIYNLPGDKLDSYEMNLFNVASKTQTKPDTGVFDMMEDGEGPDIRATAPHWMADGFHFLIEKNERGHQRLRVFNIDAHTGTTKAVIDEQSKTFIWTANRAAGQTFPVVNMLRANPTSLRDASVSNEILYASEKSGWRHLYLVDATTGETSAVDHGDWVLRGVDYIDLKKREIWFRASGVYANQDPYLIHYGHVNFDGSNQVFMTAGNGNHTVAFPSSDPDTGLELPGSFSPGPQYTYFIDRYERVDMAPVTELRRAEDGSLVVPLEKADVEAPWTPPEVFVSKGRDDVTDIWGFIARPRNFDSSKKYPIIEDIYAGPQDSFVPKTFQTGARYEALTNLGFIVVKIDGMGTANRSKAFHDVCWHNLADAGFPDRIKWIKAAAAKYPYMDITRVGIYGTSAGGQNACGALLFHPEFYKVAVANSGCHDNRMDKVSWNEEWMGYPVGPQYSASSNIDNAYRLQGHLQLVLGELDTNVPPESTFRLVDALDRANKDFEFVFIPGANHGAGIPGETVVNTKLQDFFIRYLLHKDPAEHNLQPAGATGRAGRGAAAN